MILILERTLWITATATSFILFAACQVIGISRMADAGTDANTENDGDTDASADSESNTDSDSKPNCEPTEIEFWLTTLNKSALIEKQDSISIVSDLSNQDAIIKVDGTKEFQPIDGFGYTLTGGSAIHLRKLDAATRKALLLELFGIDGNNIGVSYLRISIGASDLSGHVFSYNDLAEGQSDPNMDSFSLEPDKKELIPVLKEILSINSQIKIMGTPWSAPLWMKSNNSSVGGSLLSEHYDAYAKYFVRYIQGMAAEGIIIDAITVQNEPLHSGNNPSMKMEAEDQTAFIRQSLGPAFEAAGITTKIIIYDHNADRIDYPMSVLNDAEANRYVDGSAFHLYAGNIDDLSSVHDAFPDKNLYFTEQWVGAPGNFSGDFSWHIRNLIIGATRNWCRVVLEWNLAADPQQDPHTEGGCTQCLGAITIDGNAVSRNPAYYIVGQVSKYVRPGSVRVDSNIPGKLLNVAFRTPNDSMVVIVQNGSNDTQAFNIRYQDKYASSTLKAGAVGTYVWKCK